MINKKDALVIACSLEMNIKSHRQIMENAQKDILKYESMQNSALMSYNMGLVDGMKRSLELLQRIRNMIPVDLHWD